MKKLLIITIFFDFAMAYSQIPTNGLVRFYPFTGNAGDSSGNGHHGTVYGATLTYDRFGKNNCAYQFNDTNPVYIQIPVTDLINNRYTYSVWANSAALPSLGKVGFVFDIGSTAGDQSISIQNQYVGSTGWAGGGYNTSAPNYPLQQYSNPSTGQWYHILTVRDSNHMLLYIDGTLTDSVGTSSNRTPFYGSGTIEAMIGIRNDNTSPFKGMIDDLRIYNRTLNKKEIAALANEKTLGVKPVISHSTIKVYPNPANKVLTVNFNDYDGHIEHTLTITNQIGQVILTLPVSQQHTEINLMSLAGKGIYFIQISDKRGQINYTDQLILE